MVGSFLLAAVLTQPTNPGGRHSECGTSRHGGSAQFNRSPR